MLRLLRKRYARARRASFLPPDAPDEPIYAIGDIHGRHDLLNRLLERIHEDAAGFDRAPTLVFLGDYIDRGEGSRETLDLLCAAAGWEGVRTLFLMGNHEQMLLRFLREPKTGARWLQFGGLQTLMSYGVGGPINLRETGGAERVRADLAEALGAHLGFIEGLKLSHSSGNLCFVHAGADPALPIEEQGTETLLWGCPDFLKVPRGDGIWVVHGHTVVDQPLAVAGRISIDTGAYFSGRLTAARIATGEVSFLEA